jgi:uncharacterized protein YyaL (SSP411 family)
MNHAYTNKLVNESSPYLLQHAHNPVDWYPWGEEALEKAKKENKLVIISIGYSACHWCHVMEHESFEDSTVAKMMNDNFVCIKVDREERPDIDDIYMTACNLVTGRGGWPLNAFALPDGRPVWAGTYFPKNEWMNVLEQFSIMNKEEPDKLEQSATQITAGIQSVDQIEIKTGDVDFSEESLNQIANNFLSTIDFKEGGRNGAPKFPMPNNYEYLLKHAYATGNSRSMEAVKTTLDKIANGGIYDQIGGGFARYSTDAYWLAPHFEKMLYDNGQLVSLYANAYKISKSPLYKEKIEQTLAFVERELTSSENGFYSALDADSEGEEGKFYVWSKSEIDSLIGDEKKAKLYNEYYNVKESGNWEHTNILHVTNPLSTVSDKHGYTEEEGQVIISTINKKLLEIRETRVRPGLDDKILTSWNALMLKGYVDAYNALNEQKYLKAALANAAFIDENMMEDNYRLDRNYKNGKSTINAFLDDYGLMIDAFVSLYQATFDEQWLNKANGLLQYTLEHFYNEETKMFNYTSKLDPPLVARKSEFSDNVIPGSNSVMARNLNVIGNLLYITDYQDKSKQMMKNMFDQIFASQSPSFYSNWLQLFHDFVYPPYEIAILGDEAMEKRNAIASNYLGNALLLGGKDEGKLALLKDKLQEGDTYIYVCQNKVCKFPVTEVANALELLD